MATRRVAGESSATITAWINPARKENAMNRIVFAAIAALGLACSGEFDESVDGDDEIGALEQPVTACRSVSYQYGTRTAKSMLACARTSSGQVCSVPFSTGITGTGSNKVATWRFTPTSSFTTTQKNIIRASVLQLDSQLSSWTLVETSAPAGSLRLATARGRGSSSANHLDSLRELLLSLPNSIDEGPGVVGQHKGHSGCVGIVDITDILARGANFTQEANLLG